MSTFVISHSTQETNKVLHNEVLLRKVLHLEFVVKVCHFALKNFPLYDLLRIGVAAQAVGIAQASLDCAAV